MITSWGLTNVGRRRSLNEDTILVEDRLVVTCDGKDGIREDHLLVVCDGMGGHLAGEVASALAVKTLANHIRRASHDNEITWPFGIQINASLESNLLRTAVKIANRAVFRQATSSSEYSGMGTTLTTALVSESPPHVTFANVGDSRIYLIQNGAITQLTRDDSWANLWSEGNQPVDIPANMKHVLTKAIGAQDDLEFDVATRPLDSGDVLLLCSDGLTNMIADSRILEIIQQNGFEPKASCERLIAEANENGGRDNISAIVARFHE